MAGLPSYDEYIKEHQAKQGQLAEQAAQLGYTKLGGKWVKTATPNDQLKDEISTRQGITNLNQDTELYPITKESAELELQNKRLTNNKLMTEQKTGTPEQKQQASIKTILEQIEGLSSKVNYSNNRGLQYLKKLGSTLQYDPDAAELDSKQAYLAPIIRSLGEKGALSDSDVNRAMGAIPTSTDTKAVAQRKLNSLKAIINSANSAGSVAPVTNGRFQIEAE